VIKEKSHIRPLQVSEPLSFADKQTDLKQISHTYDPLQAVRRDAHRFNLVWLSQGRMTPIQRLGFMMFSLAFCIAGAYSLNVGVELFRDEERIFVFWIFLGFGFLFIGILGLRNALRKKASEQL